MAGNFKLGNAVKVAGLESEQGKQLNGRRGVIVDFARDTGRYEVKFSANRSANVKPANLTQVPNLPSDEPLLRGIEGVDPDARSPCVHQELPFKEKDAVQTFGLQSETGRELNGKNGIILKYIEESGRYEVRFSLGMVGNEFKYKIVQLKPEQLVMVEKNPMKKSQKSQAKAESAPSQPYKWSNRGGYPDSSAGAGAAEEKPFRAGDFFPGDEVEIFGLQSETGKLLNGRTASIWGYVDEKVVEHSSDCRVLDYYVPLDPFLMDHVTGKWSADTHYANGGGSLAANAGQMGSEAHAGG